MRVAIPGTDIKYDSRNSIVSLYYGEMYSRFVAVPATVSNNLFLLDFQAQLKTIIKLEGEMSTQLLDQLMSIFVASYDKIKVDDLVAQLNKLNLKIDPSVLREGQSNDDALRDLVTTMQRRIASLATESGMSNLVIKNVLTDRSGTLSLDGFAKTDMAAVASAVVHAQKFYADFVENKSGDDLARDLGDFIETNPVLSAARALFRVLRSSSGGFVQARESYVMDELFKISFGEPIVQKKTLLQGKVYFVDRINVPEIKFPEAIDLFMWSLHRMMGHKSEAGAEGKMKLSSIVDDIVTGVGETMPFAPAEAGDSDSDNMSEHYRRTYLMHLFRRLVTDSPGDYKGRIQNSIKTSKYWKLGANEDKFNEGLYILSAVFEAFRDNAFYYRDLYRDEKILFKDFQLHSQHPVRRKQIVDFVENQISNFGDFAFGTEHPAYYRLPGHVTAHTASPLSAEPITFQYSFPKRERLSTPPYIIGDKSEAFLRVFSAGLISGNWYDVNDGGLRRSVRMCQNARVLEPNYFFSIAAQDGLLATKVVKHLFGIYPLSKILELRDEYPDIFDDIMEMGQMIQFGSPEELSMMMQVPVEIAEVIWNRRDGIDVFLDLTHVVGMKVFVDSRITKMYEQKLLSQDRYVAPFIGVYPVLDEEENVTYAINSSIVEPVVRKPNIEAPKKGPHTPPPADENPDDAAPDDAADPANPPANE